MHEGEVQQAPAVRFSDENVEQFQEWLRLPPRRFLVNPERVFRAVKQSITLGRLQIVGAWFDINRGWGEGDLAIRRKTLGSPLVGWRIQNCP